MALTDFPQSPTDGQTTTINGNRYTYDAAKDKWTGSFSEGRGTVYYADVAPSAPNNGDVWFDSLTSLRMYIWTGSEWIDTTTVTDVTPVIAPSELAGNPGNGTSGQLLQSDGDGTFSWVDAPSGGGGAASTYSITRTGNSGSVTIPTTCTSLTVTLITLSYTYAHNDSNNGSGTVTISAGGDSDTYSYSLTNTGGTSVSRTVTNQGARTLSFASQEPTFSWSGSGSHSFTVTNVSFTVVPANTVTL